MRTPSPLPPLRDGRCATDPIARSPTARSRHSTGNPLASTARPVRRSDPCACSVRSVTSVSRDTGVRFGRSLLVELVERSPSAPLNRTGRSTHRWDSETGMSSSDEDDECACTLSHRRRSPALSCTREAIDCNSFNSSTRWQRDSSGLARGQELALSLRSRGTDQCGVVGAAGGGGPPSGLRALSPRAPSPSPKAYTPPGSALHTRSAASPMGQACTPPQRGASPAQHSPCPASVPLRAPGASSSRQNRPAMRLPVGAAPSQGSVAVVDAGEAGGIRLRVEPDRENFHPYEVSDREEVTVLECQGAWRLVRRRSGGAEVGWIRERYLRSGPRRPPELSGPRWSAARVNTPYGRRLRIAPLMEAAYQYEVDDEEVVDVLQWAGEWAQVQRRKSKDERGWLRRKYLAGLAISPVTPTPLRPGRAAQGSAFDGKQPEPDRTPPAAAQPDRSPPTVAQQGFAVRPEDGAPGDAPSTPFTDSFCSPATAAAPPCRALPSTPRSAGRSPLPACLFDDPPEKDTGCPAEGADRCSPGRLLHLERSLAAEQEQRRAAERRAAEEEKRAAAVEQALAFLQEQFAEEQRLHEEAVECSDERQQRCAAERRAEQEQRKREEVEEERQRLELQLSALREELAEERQQRIAAEQLAALGPAACTAAAAAAAAEDRRGAAAGSRSLSTSAEDRRDRRGSLGAPRTLGTAVDERRGSTIQSRSLNTSAFEDRRGGGAPRASACASAAANRRASAGPPRAVCASAAPPQRQGESKSPVPRMPSQTPPPRPRSSCDGTTPASARRAGGTRSASSMRRRGSNASSVSPHPTTPSPRPPRRVP
eukprot:TRINITY_DN7246_c0_g1_i1.p1 TRINITY_DN7246_c0_g1~~TRINITY_DN7246_c0_g1_i1.p1  ORF type:complete len:824 (+),score=184.33 TRINITY_DN7246_c0_g1_i1:113-2584(+)